MSRFDAYIVERGTLNVDTGDIDWQYVGHALSDTDIPTIDRLIDQAGFHWNSAYDTALRRNHTIEGHVRVRWGKVIIE